MPLGEQGCCRPAHLTGHLSGSAEPGHAAMCQNRQPPPERLGFFLPPQNGSFESCSRGKTVEGRSAAGYLGEGGPGGHHMGALKAGDSLSPHTSSSLAVRGTRSQGETSRCTVVTAAPSIVKGEVRGGPDRRPPCPHPAQGRALRVGRPSGRGKRTHIRVSRDGGWTPAPARPAVGQRQAACLKGLLCIFLPLRTQEPLKRHQKCLVWMFRINETFSSPSVVAFVMTNFLRAGYLCNLR